MGVSQTDAFAFTSPSTWASVGQPGWARSLEKKLTALVEQVQKKHPDADVEVWCEDEQTLEDSLPLRYRIGLQPVSRRLWVEEGEQPVAVVNWKREWLWLYAFVQPQTGETYWWMLPYVNTKLFSRVLKDFAQHFRVGKNKHIIHSTIRWGSGCHG